MTGLIFLDNRSIQIAIFSYFFLFLHKNICCGYSLEVPQRGTSNEYPQHTFSWRNKKNINTVLSENAPYLDVWRWLHEIKVLIIVIFFSSRKYDSTIENVLFKMFEDFRSACASAQSDDRSQSMYSQGTTLIRLWRYAGWSVICV